MSLKTLMAGAMIVVAGIAAACSGAATAAPAASASRPRPPPHPRLPRRSGDHDGDGRQPGHAHRSRLEWDDRLQLHEGRRQQRNGACTGACITKWPALTVPAGTTATAGPGVTGTIGTITRPDDGTLQVTYNGLPLYFFAGDKAPGDPNGIYTGWTAVKP